MKRFNAGILVLVIGLVIPVARGGASPGQGMVLTVGPGGTHSTIQAGIDAALNSLNNSPIEIRVRAGAYFEHVGVPVAMSHGSVTLSGGWNADFTARDPNPALTRVDGGAQGRVFDIASSGGELTIDGFTVTNGAVPGDGAGLSIRPTGSATITVTNNHIRNNTAGGQTAYGTGGGLYANLRNATRLVVADNLIVENRCDGGSAGPASGAGLRLDAVHDATFFVRGNRIENNRLIATGNQCTGVGVFVLTYNASSGELSDNVVRNNVAESGAVVGVAAALWMIGDATGRITARRNAWVDNGDVFFDADVSLIAAHTGTILFTDSVVANSKGVGVGVDARDSGAVYLTNLTVTGNQNRGLYFYPDTGTMTLHNSILYDNAIATNLDGVNAANNLIDVDPQFVDAEGRNYQLRATSPAIDAGTNNPPGGLGPSDLDGHARIEGGAVDIGAYELSGPDFALSFEQASVTAARGTKVRVRITIERLGGFTGDVTVAPPDLSAIGVKSKPRRPLSTTGSSLSFKLKIKAGATPGSHQVVFTGRDDSGRERSGTLTLTIQ